MQNIYFVAHFAALAGCNTYLLPSSPANPRFEFIYILYFVRNRQFKINITTKLFGDILGCSQTKEENSYWVLPYKKNYSAILTLWAEMCYDQIIHGNMFWF